ncbi:ATP-binding protein [Brucella pseudogrignonensis]
MLAEQVEDSRDDKIMVGYTISDLSSDTLRIYRQVFANRDPSHPWNEIDDQEFIRLLGGWRTDRETGKSGLTLAGLLMFGDMVAIQEALPFYMLDYQERPQAKAESRWIDRLTLDGKWSGNLYDFYRRVYLKLTSDLKVPFHLENGERQEETPVHVALREALANVLAHADYTDRASVLVVKRPDMFGFRNPGLMRIPVDVAMHGGEADCRNRTVHKMFRLVGVGEQAGTGIPKIFMGWQSQHWNPPKFYDTPVPYNQTLLELRMIDLFPADVMAELKAKFGDKLDELNYEGRVALAIAASEGTVNHARLCAVSVSHPVEISRTLQHLTSTGMLQSTGGRGAVYKLPWQETPTPDDVFGSTFRSSFSSTSTPEISNLGSSSSDLDLSSSVLSFSSSDLNLSSSDNAHRSIEGYWISTQLPLPVIDDLSHLSEDMVGQLEKIAELPRTKKKVSHSKLEEVLLEICDGHYLTLQCISKLINRRPEALRNEYLTPMVRDRALSLAFPTTPTHERQAYCSTRSLNNLAD